MIVLGRVDDGETKPRDLEKRRIADVDSKRAVIRARVKRNHVRSRNHAIAARDRMIESAIRTDGSCRDPRAPRVAFTKHVDVHASRRQAARDIDGVNRDSWHC